MTPIQSSLMSYLYANPTTTIPIVWYKGTECYAGVGPLPAGVLSDGVITGLEEMNLIHRHSGISGDYYSLQ